MIHYDAQQPSVGFFICIQSGMLGKNCRMCLCVLTALVFLTLLCYAAAIAVVVLLYYYYSQDVSNLCDLIIVFIFSIMLCDIQYL